MIKSWMFKGIAPFLNGWSYRKSITLSRASGAITNYQMKLLVGESSGATGEDVDCGSHCLSSFNDIRFTTSDGTTLLDYWIESISGATPNQLATIWIEFNSIGTGATTFYMYYGNAGAAAYSNGANTFISFDDFERGSNGDTIGGNWTETVAHAHISTEQAFGGIKSAKLLGNAEPTDRPTVTIPFTAASGVYAIRCRYYKEVSSVIIALIQHGNSAERLLVGMDGSANIVYYDGSWIDTGANCSVDSWGLIEVRNINFVAATYDIYHNDVLIKSSATTHTSSALNNIIKAYGDNSAADRDCWFDNFIVRNWRSTEPAWGAWGAEES